MKRIIALVLVLMTTSVTVLSTGCGIVTRGSDYCYRFLDYICNSEFEKAYEMIDDSIKAPETDEEREARLKEEQKAKEEKTRFWKDVFGIEDKEAETTPTPAVTDTPAPEGTPEPVSTDPVMQNGATPNPETGEYPDPEPTPTPDPNATPTPMPTPTPDPNATPEPTPTPSLIPIAETVSEDGYRPMAGIETPTPVPSATPGPTDTPDPKATPDPNATPSPTPAATDDAEEPKADETITRVGFVEKYESIFDELMLTGIDYEATDVTDGEIVAIVNYDLTYHSDRAGEDLTYSFQIRANRIEHRWSIEWSPSLIFPMMEWGDNLRVGVLQANRGEILCGGEPYAQNVNIITVFAVPSTIPDLDQFCVEVAAIPEMETTEEAVREAIGKQRNDFAKLQTFFPDEIGLALQERILAVKGLAIDTANYGTQRYYPYGSSLCHIIGYAGIISKKEKVNYELYGDIRWNPETQRFETSGETRYNGDSWIGKYGLELLYEDTLLGTNGRFTYVQDGKGGSRGMLYSQKAVDGQDLHLTIIPELQERLEDVIETTVYDSKIHGAVIVLNPKTGAIQAMTSWPGFDLNYLARGMPAEEWEALQNDPTIPLYNRATQGLYTPGSVFKVLTSAALLETNSMTANDTFPSSETVTNDTWAPSNALMATFDGTTFGENRSELADDSFMTQSDNHVLARTRADSNPGPMNLENSIIWSDNLYFSYAALRMGAKKFEDYMLNKLEWNTPIQLEAEGTEPRIYWKTDPSDPEGAAWLRYEEGGTAIWKQNENGEWAPMNGNLVLDKDPIYGMDVSTPQLYSSEIPQSDYDLAVTGYGQGQILMSPLQLACYVSAYANDGVVMQPYLIDSIWHADGTDYTLVEQRNPKVYKRLLQQSTVDTVYPYLIEVCHKGTARSMFTSFLRKNSPLTIGYELAGKTGTAEITNNKTKELAWFVCWRDSDKATGAKVTEDNARLVCVLLEIDLRTASDEWGQMKYDIARAMLKKDILNNDSEDATA